MTYQWQSYVPLRNMRNRRSKTSPRPSYWPLKSKGDVSKEGISQGDPGTESIEVWSTIKNVKDYFLNTGYQLIDTIKAFCKKPRILENISDTSPHQSNITAESLIHRLIKKKPLDDVSRKVWPNSLEPETSTWIKNMLSDPGITGDAKLTICRLVENNSTAKAATVPSNIFVSNQQRFSPHSVVPYTPRNSAYGSRQISPRLSLYDRARSASGLPPLRLLGRVSNTMSERRSRTPFGSETSSRGSPVRSESGFSLRRGSTNSSGVRSLSSDWNREFRLPRSTKRDIKLSPSAKYRSLVKYSDSPISPAQHNNGRKKSAILKEGFDNYTQLKKRQFVGSRTRLRLSAGQKLKQQKRKSYQNRSVTSSAKRSRSDDKKEGSQANLRMDIDSVSTAGTPNKIHAVAAPKLNLPSGTKIDYTWLNKSSKDEPIHNAQSPMSAESVTQNSLVAGPKPGIAANLFGTIPNKGRDSVVTPQMGTFFETASKVNVSSIEKRATTKTSLDKARAKPLASFTPDTKSLKEKTFQSANPKLLCSNITAKQDTSLFVPKPTSKIEEKSLDTKLSEKVSSEKALLSNVKVAETEPVQKASENVSYACQMARMRRIKIKEYYSQEIKKLYDRHCNDNNKKEKIKKAIDIYKLKYHNTGQDHIFWTKLCKKYKVEPGEEYDGNGPHIKHDREEVDNSETKKLFTEEPAPFLFGTPKTKVNGAEKLEPLGNNRSVMKDPAKFGGFNFGSNDSNLFIQKFSERKKLFSAESRKSPTGWLKADNLFSGKVVSSIPSLGLFEKPIQKDQEPAPFSFGLSQQSNGKSIVKCASKGQNILADKPSAGVFGGDSNSALTIPKPSTTLSHNNPSTLEKPVDGALFRTTVQKTKSSIDGDGKVLDGTLPKKSYSSPKMLTRCGRGITSANDTLANSKTSPDLGDLLLPQSHATSTTLFSCSKSGKLNTNDSINNKNEKSEPKCSFEKVSKKSSINSKKRKIAFDEGD